MRGGLHQQNYGSRQREGSRLRMTIIGLAFAVHACTHARARAHTKRTHTRARPIPTRPPGKLLPRDPVLARHLRLPPPLPVGPRHAASLPTTRSGAPDAAACANPRRSPRHAGARISRRAESILRDKKGFASRAGARGDIGLPRVPVGC